MNTEGNKSENNIIEDVRREDNTTETVKDNDKKSKTRKSLTKRVISCIFIIICMIIIFALILLWYLNFKGKSELYGARSSDVPSLESSNNDSFDSDAESDVEWQQGWVRYNGDIYEYNSDILTFLVMGIDKNSTAKAVSEGIYGGQADLLFLAVIDPRTEEISLIAINRNTMTEIDVYDEAGEYIGSGIGQICLQHGYGDAAEVSCERTVKAVSNLFYNLPIHGYFSINMGAMTALNDAVGGVTITLDEDFVETMDGKTVSISKGQHTLTNTEAYVYLRYRDHDAFDSATERFERQQKYVAAFFKAFKEKTAEDVTTPIKVYNELAPYIVTDINTSKITYMATNMLDYSFDAGNIHSLEGTTRLGENQHEEFIYDQDKLYELIIDTFYKKVEK